MENSPHDFPVKRQLARRAAGKLVMIVILLGLMFFLPAGSLRFWEAWAFIAVLVGAMTALMFYFFKHDPRLLERRMQMKEKERPQKLYVKLSVVFFAVSWLLPGFDRRWGWSSVPAAVVILADVLFLAAYLLFFWVMKTNSYASRTIEVVEGQRVVATGPYAYVRHPMYLAALVMYAISPLALGSYWAVIAFLPLPFLIAFRIRNEEEVLMRELPGYREYRENTPYRLLPHVW
jgi:protein-S-isoprenylcysteine O-methyltransferase Ste14